MPLEKRARTLWGLSGCMLWKGEVALFQKILDERASLFTTLDEKKRAEHFPSLITSYDKGGIIENLRKKLREHENRLAQLLENVNGDDTQYFTEYAALTEEVDKFSNGFIEFRKEILGFIKAAKH